MSIKITNTLSKGLLSYFSKVAMNQQAGADFTARARTAMQILSWTNKGSSQESTVPPIKYGILRGSGSVFVGSKLVRTTAGDYQGGTPCTDYSSSDNNITIGYNTAYAARLHERDDWTPGKISTQSGNVGNKWLEKHLAADGPAAMKMYAAELKELTGA